MDFVENIRVSEERAEAGFCAEQDRPSTIFGAREVSGIRFAEDTSAQGDELFGAGFDFFCHRVASASTSGFALRSARMLSHFRNKHFECTKM